MSDTFVTAKLPKLAPYRARYPAFIHTIQAKILLAVLAMGMIAGSVGAYSLVSIGRAGDLVVETFDRSLMSINYARAAAADFAGMQVAQARLAASLDPAQQSEAAQRIEDAARALREDLEIAGMRAQSARATNAVQSVGYAVDAWVDLQGHLTEPRRHAADLSDLDQRAQIVHAQLERLINYVAADGFSYRQRALAAVKADRKLNLLGTLAALALSSMVMWYLGRHIKRPIAAASAAAKSIAQGKLDTPIPTGGVDELGGLLEAMAIMRNNIRAMVGREIEQRQSAEMSLIDAMEGSHDGVILVGCDGRIVTVNSQARTFFALVREFLAPGSLFAAFVNALSDGTGAAPTETASADAILAEQVAGAREAQLADGRWLLISRSATQQGGFVIVCNDITSLKQREAELKRTNLWFNAALSNMSQGISLYDSSNTLRVFNDRFCETYQLAPDRIRAGMEFFEVIEASVEANNHLGTTAAEIYREECRFLSKGRHTKRFQKLSDGRVVAVSHEALADGGWVRTYEDVTERQLTEAKVLFMARHDVVTGLANRVSFGERMEQAVAQLGRGVKFAVLILDLDRFKEVNDTLGHLVGDKLLRAVADRLKACARETDTVARLGGDEFAIVLQGIERPEDVIELAQRAIGCVAQPYDLDGHHVVIGTSAGIALAPADGNAGEMLLRKADLALYRAKADGRGTFRFFEEEMDVRIRERRALESDLREAARDSAFEVHYQPLVNIDSGRISGFEALVRWRHPVRGMVSPAEFIPLAEETGLIIQLGEWVLQRACHEATGWPDHVKVAVNVSQAQFKSQRLVRSVIDALETSGLPATRLELEITESVLLTDNSKYLAILHELRSLGVRISMDDFGTGYSSLSHLRSFPFDKIKIDQSFVRDLATTEDSGAIVRAIVSLGRSLGMCTTAEGVETAEQLARLKAEGCTEVQGYLFGRPKAAPEIRAMLHAELEQNRHLAAAA